MPPGTSAQATELRALTRGLQLAKGQQVNVFTDSRYVFSTLHIFRAIWKHCGLLGARGGGVKHGVLILDLLQAVHKPAKVAAMHCRAHQWGDTEIHEGNRHSDAAAKRATKQPFTAAQMLNTLSPLSLPPHPEY